MKILNMPSFGADMAQGTVTKWLVKPGDKVHKGDIIATIETMKGLIDMEVFDEGTVIALIAKEGEELTTGEPIATLRLNDEPQQSTEEKTREWTKSPVEDTAKTQVLPKEAITSIPLIAKKIEPEQAISDHLETRKKISPAARKKAENQGIDWQKMGKGSGPDGALVLADILSEESQPAKPPKDPMRQAIAATVSRSKREIPHYYLTLDVDLDPALAWLGEYNEDLVPAKRILINAVIYSAIARALKKFPEFNGFYRDGQFQPSEAIHLGNIINLRKSGIIVVAIHDANKLTLPQLMEKLKDQVERTRTGGLKMSEVQDPTITVSNLGDRGCDSIQSVIFPPQVAILGIGKPRKMPWVKDEALTIANIATLSLAADHRVSDGHDGARFLTKIQKLLQSPEKLL